MAGLALTKALAFCWGQHDSAGDPTTSCTQVHASPRYRIPKITHGADLSVNQRLDGFEMRRAGPLR